MNQTVGKLGAGITGISVSLFAISMIVRLFTDQIGLFLSCLSSLFIAIGFVIFICSIFSVDNKTEHRAVGVSGTAFAAIYAVIIFLVYFAEITTVRMNGTLSKEVLSIISYGYIGSLFFNYDMLGYAMMALSTFLVAFAVVPKSKGDKAFRILLWIHGVFFLSCLIVPMFPVFKAGASVIPGTILLETWCAYFLPVCILGFRYFRIDEKSLTA
jgi:hypothetical protein